MPPSQGLDHVCVACHVESNRPQMTQIADAPASPLFGIAMMQTPQPPPPTDKHPASGIFWKWHLAGMQSGHKLSLSQEASICAPLTSGCCNTTED